MIIIVIIITYIHNYLHMYTLYTVAVYRLKPKSKENKIYSEQCII